jgi:hypothetical protein
VIRGGRLAKPPADPTVDPEDAMSRDANIRKSPGKATKRTMGYPLRDPADIERETARDESERNEERKEHGRSAGPTDLRPGELDEGIARPED